MRRPLASDSDAERAALSNLQRRLLTAAPADQIDAWLGDLQELVCIRDLKGKVLRLSPAWADALGVPVEGLSGIQMLDLVHPEDVWMTHDVMQSVNMRHPVVGFTNRYRRRDGEYVRLSWTARLIGGRVVGVARTIVEPATL